MKLFEKSYSMEHFRMECLLNFVQNANAPKRNKAKHANAPKDETKRNKIWKDALIFMISLKIQQLVSYYAVSESSIPPQNIPIFLGKVRMVLRA